MRDESVTMPALFSQAQALTGLGSTPLVVLTATASPHAPGRSAAQDRMAALSTNSQPPRRGRDTRGTPLRGTRGRHLGARHRRRRRPGRPHRRVASGELNRLGDAGRPSSLARAHVRPALHGPPLEGSALQRGVHEDRIEAASANADNAENSLRSPRGSGTAGFGGAVLAGLGAGGTSSLAATVGWALLFTVLSAVLGLGIAMVVRNSTAAISGILVWGFVVENLFKLFLAEEVARFLPFIAGNHLLAYNSDFETPKTLAIALTRPENALVFGGYAAVALAVGTVLLYRRDMN
jgi:hypothetical protein